MQKFFCDICEKEAGPRPDNDDGFVRGVKHPAFYLLQGTILIGFQTWDFSASRLNGDHDLVSKPIDLCRECLAKMITTATPVNHKGVPLKDLIPKHAQIRDLWDADMSFEALNDKHEADD